jgi:hypothetical protein
MALLASMKVRQCRCSLVIPTTVRVDAVRVPVKKFQRRPLLWILSHLAHCLTSPYSSVESRDVNHLEAIASRQASATTASTTGATEDKHDHCRRSQENAVRRVTNCRYYLCVAGFLHSIFSAASPVPVTLHYFRDKSCIKLIKLRRSGYVHNAMPKKHYSLLY